jgi:type VI secretion system protein ImpK
MRLVDCFTEVFLYVRYLAQRQSSGSSTADTPASLSFETVRKDINGLFEKSEQVVQQAGFNRSDLNNACFAVCAWVDESILCSGWNGRNQWLKDPLQRHMFNTANAGEEFIERMKNLGPDQNAVREVFHTCLVMNFSGPFYGEHGERKLDELKRHNARLLWGQDFKPADFMEAGFPAAYPKDKQDSTEKQSWNKRSWSSVGIMIGAPFVLILLFLFYSAVLDGTVEEFFDSAQQDSE